MNVNVEYLRALVQHALGRQVEARRHFDEAEALHQRSLSNSLASDELKLAPPYQLNWWEPAFSQVVRAEAWKEIQGKAQAADLWWHLVQARAYAKLGETDKAEAELAAATTAAADDPEVWPARGRLLGKWGEIKRAEADLQKAVDLAGADPLPWIHRGRWYAERGEHEKADADFAKAASLTPNELNKFLEAGWWVVGPYPPNVDEFCPPEIDPDPSKPADCPATGTKSTAPQVPGRGLPDSSGRQPARSRAYTRRTGPLVRGGGDPARPQPSSHAF